MPSNGRQSTDEWCVLLKTRGNSTAVWKNIIFDYLKIVLSGRKIIYNNFEKLPYRNK